MRLRSLYQIVFCALSIWFLLVCLYILLPSPSYQDDGTGYATSVLNSGRTLTRVFEYVVYPFNIVLQELTRHRIGDFYPYFDKSEIVQRARESNRQAFALDFTLDPGFEILRIGSEQVINLTKLSTEMKFISESFVVSARTGDRDGINPAWLYPADAMLLFWKIHHDTAEIPLHVQWSDYDNVEIWPDLGRWVSQARLRLRRCPFP